MYHGAEAEGSCGRVFFRLLGLMFAHSGDPARCRLTGADAMVPCRAIP